MLRGEENPTVDELYLCLWVSGSACTRGVSASVGHHGAAGGHSHPINVSGHGDFRNTSAGHAVASARLCATSCF